MFKVRVITSTALISLAFLSLSTPGRAQDVFSGNDNAQQQNNDRGGFPTKRLPPIVNSFCPDEQPYYYNKDGYLMVKPGYSCGRRQGVENDVAPYDPDDCSKGAPGAYDPSQNPRCQTPYRRAARNPLPRPGNRTDHHGTKGIGRGLQGPDQPTSLPTNFEDISQGIDACFKRYLPGYHSPDWNLYSKKAPAPQDDRAFERAFTASRDGAEQALRAAGPLRHEDARHERSVDYLTGWLTGCLGDRDVLPLKGAQLAYRRWVSAVYPSATEEEKKEHEANFRIGFGNREQRPFD